MPSRDERSKLGPSRSISLHSPTLFKAQRMASSQRVAAGKRRKRPARRQNKIGFGEQGLALLILWQAGNEWAAITNTLNLPPATEEPKKPSDD